MSKYDIDKAAEAQYKREESDVKAEGRSSAVGQIIVVLVVVLLYGTIHVIDWLFFGAALFLTKQGASWTAALVGGALIFDYLYRVHSEFQAISSKRMIRVELAIRELSERQQTLETIVGELDGSLSGALEQIRKDVCDVSA